MNYLITKRTLLILSFFFLIRFIFAYFFGWQDPNIADGGTYNHYALAILNQPDWLSNPIFHGDSRAPGYPIFLAIIYAIFGAENLLAVFFIQALIGTLTVYYIFRLSSCIFSENKSYLALLWSGFYIFYFLYYGTITREPLVVFLVIFAFYHLWMFFYSEEKTFTLKNKDLWKFIISFSYLLHTDARFLFYIPFISILFIIYRKIWIGIKKYTYVLMIVIMLLVPWTIRNYIAYDGFVLINTMTLDARQDNVSIRLAYLSTDKISEVREEPFVRLNNKYPTEEERALIKQGENPNNRLDQEISLIMKDVYPPSSFIERKLYYIADMWLPYRFEWGYRPFPQAQLSPSWSLRHNFFAIFCYGTLIPFLLIALFYLVIKKNKAVWFLAFPIFVHALLHFLTFGVERYRSHISAFIIILACFGMVIVYDFIKLRWNGYNN